MKWAVTEKHPSLAVGCFPEQRNSSTTIGRTHRSTTRSIHHNWRFPPVRIRGLVSTHITIAWSSVSANLNTTRPSTILGFRSLITPDMGGGSPEHLGQVSIQRPVFIKLLFRPSFKYIISSFQHPIRPSTKVSVGVAMSVSFCTLHEQWNNKENS